MELCRVIDAASVNLKSFSDEIYRKLNSGTLGPVLATLKTLRREGVWTEVIHLVVPTYTDKPELIRPMCDWLAENLGPDCPLHFSRFHPAHKLTNLPPTPVDVLLEARDIARPERFALRLHRQCPRRRRVRDHLLPRLQAAGGRAGSFLDRRDGSRGGQVQVVRDEDRRRLAVGTWRGGCMRLAGLPWLLLFSLVVALGCSSN